MPYDVRKAGEKWEVINTDTQDVKATHDTEEAAKRQVALLREIEKDEGWK